MTSKVQRDTQLAQMAVEIRVFVTKEKARLTKEELWLRGLQKTLGLSAVKEANAASAAKSVRQVVEEIVA